MENIFHAIKLPIVQSVIKSISLFLILFVPVFIIHHIIKRSNLQEEKRRHIKKWIVQVVFLLYGFLLIRIWSVLFLVEEKHFQFLDKILKSGLILVIFFLLIYLGRHFVDLPKIEIKRSVLLKRLVTYSLVIIYSLILVRIWAVKTLFQNKIFYKFSLSLIFLGIIYLLLYFVRGYINNLKIEIGTRHQYRKRVSYVATTLYIIVLIIVWAESTIQWATVLSVTGAGLALALHEVLLNMAGWVYIVIRHPYRAGDRIEIGNIRGDVIDIRLFQTSLLEIGNWIDGDQSTGRLIHLPHGQIFRNPLYNYTQGFEYIWNEISILVTFESQWQKAKEILLKFGEEESREIQERVEKKIDRMAREYLIYFKKFTPIVYTRIEDNGVKLTLRYLTDVKRRRMVEDTISQKILQAFQTTADIDFAYPTYRIYRRGEENSANPKNN